MNTLSHNCCFVIRRLALCAVLVGPTVHLAPSAIAQLATPATSALDVVTPTRSDTNLTPRQLAYHQATPEMRVSYVEAIGEDGTRQLARRLGWEPICDGLTARQIRGFDQVWRDADWLIHVIESKGGSSQLGRGYGFRQATPEWAVAAAEKTLTNPRATTLEREAARQIIEAAKSGRLRTHVMRTTHVYGEPGLTVIEESMTGTRHSVKLAESATRSLAKRGIDVTRPLSANSLATGARAVPSGTARALVVREGPWVPKSPWVRPSPKSPLLKRGPDPFTGPVRPSYGKALGAASFVAMAAVLDGGLRIADSVEIERQYDAGNIDYGQAQVEHARNWGGMAGGWTVGAGGAWAGAAGGAAIGTAICPGPGTVIGGLVGGLCGGTAGYIAGDQAGGAAAGAIAAHAGRSKLGMTLPRFE